MSGVPDIDDDDDALDENGEPDFDEGGAAHVAGNDAPTPEDDDAELDDDLEVIVRDVLGWQMLEKIAVDYVRKEFGRLEFASVTHNLFQDVISDLADRGKPVSYFDVATVAAERKPEIGHAWALDYLRDCAACAPKFKTVPDIEEQLAWALHKLRAAGRVAWKHHVDGASMAGETRTDAPSRPAITATRFPLIPFGELTVDTARDYLIKGLFPRVGVVVIYGPPKCGKSFWLFDALLHPAIGWKYRGRRVLQGPVVYCAFEGAKGYKKRAAAFRKHHGIDEPAVGGEPLPEVPFYLQPIRMDLIRDHPALIESIRIVLGDKKPAAVALDTLNRSLVGSESNDEDMAAYFSAAEAIEEAFDCLVAIVHHTGWDESRQRGHSSLKGNAAEVLSVKCDDDGRITVKVEASKDSEAGAVVISRLKVVCVGKDDDGDDITSCVVVPADDDDNAPAKPTPRLPNAAKIALKALKEALVEAGEAPPASSRIPSNVTTVVTVELWRKYAYLRGISDGEERAQQKAFQRAREALIAAGIVHNWGELVWILPD